MTPRLFSKKLGDLGLNIDRENPRRFVRHLDAGSQYVSRDSVRGSAWRLFLAVSPVPREWPGVLPQQSEITAWVEAESPWFQYFTDLDPTDPLDAQCDSREVAMQKCFDWFVNAGMKWLDRPDDRSDERWRIDYNILVRRPHK